MTETNVVPRLRSIRLYDTLRCEEAIQKLRGSTGLQWMAVRRFGNRYFGFIYRGVVGVVAHSLMKPPSQSLVAWPRRGTVTWIPGQRTEDLVELCKEVDARSLEEHVLWYELCRVDFGFVHKGVPPRRVRPEMAVWLHRDISADTIRDLLSRKNAGLWWQEWGGRLFAAWLECAEGKASFEVQLLGQYVGPYRRIPIRFVR